ncbi:MULTISPECIES: hypothetical protein [unclassified Streptomyces]|uniref:hypothetical protein n=1 Tax=unclassified Streptomyces TaxID=2593676 RepID=UPI003432400F
MQRTLATQANTAAGKTAATTVKQTTETKANKAAEPPLSELVPALLVQAAEPRLVSEVTTELAQAHPDRPRPSRRAPRPGNTGARSPGLVGGSPTL